MITVPQEQIGKLLRGEKTLHFTPRDPSKRKPFEVGNSYAVQAVSHREVEGKKVREVTGELARIRVDCLDRDVLVPEFPDDVAQAAGFVDSLELFGYWRETHNEGPFNAPLLWVVSFTVVTKPRMLAARPSSTGKPDHDDSDEGADHNLGYTTSASRALEDAGECPPREWTDEESKWRSARDQAFREAKVEAGWRAKWRHKRARRAT